jgi:hypothetical protein
MRHYKCKSKHNDSDSHHCEECFQKQLKIDRLEEEVQRLKAQLRYRNKRDQEPFGISTPSSKITIKKSTLEENQQKTGGAQEGHQGHGRKKFTEAEADEIIDLKVKLTNCPDCGGKLGVKGVDERFVVDALIQEAIKIIYRCQVKRCTCCKAEISNTPLVLPMHKYGNKLIAETIVQHYGVGTPLNTIGEMWGPDVSTSALQNILHNLADKFKPTVEQLIQDYRQSHVRHADETGWRTDGKNGYAWLFCSENISIFEFGKTRAKETPLALFGALPLSGVLIVDRYAGYNRMPCKIQYCYEHLKRDLIKLGELNPDNEEVQRFVRVLLPRIIHAIKLKERSIPDATYYVRAKVLKARIIKITNESAQHPGIQTYQDIFRSNPERLYHWVEDRRIPSHNNRGERELRPSVIARKISFGSQSARGAKTRSIWMTIVQTAAKRLSKQSLKSWLVYVLDELARNPAVNLYSLLPPPIAS